MTEQMQELWCNECGRYLRFRIKPEKNGRLIIVCDHCRHQHCRHVRNGIVTDSRWGMKNGWFQKGPKNMGVMANSNEKSLWEEQKAKEKALAA